MRRSRWLWLLGFLGPLALGACGEPESSRVEEAAEQMAEGAAGAAAPRSPAAGEPVAIQRVALDTIRTSMAASGSIRARRVTEIGAEVGGSLFGPQTSSYRSQLNSQFRSQYSAPIVSGQSMSRSVMSRAIYGGFRY